MRTGKPLASKDRIAPAPLLPARKFAQVLRVSWPTGVTMPRPVMAMRRFGFMRGNDAGGSGASKAKVQRASRLRIYAVSKTVAAPARRWPRRDSTEIVRLFPALVMSIASNSSRSPGSMNARSFMFVTDLNFHSRA